MQSIMDKKHSEQIILLDSIGFQPREIGDLIGKTANAVSTALCRAKKKVSD